MTIMAERPVAVRTRRPRTAPEQPPANPEPQTPETDEAPAAATTTHIMHTLNETGDGRIEWTRGNRVEVRAAEDHFAKMKTAGYAAYRINGDGSREIMHTFDETAERVAFTPPLQGG